MGKTHCDLFDIIIVSIKIIEGYLLTGFEYIEIFVINSETGEMVFKY